MVGAAFHSLPRVGTPGRRSRLGCSGGCTEVRTGRDRLVDPLQVSVAGKRVEILFTSHIGDECRDPLDPERRGLDLDGGHETRLP